MKTTREIAGAVESLEIFKILNPLLMVWDFHIHWTATNGGKGCTTKAISVSRIHNHRFAMLAKLGLSEQALTGDLLGSLDVKCLVYLSRNNELEVEAELGLPQGRHTILIPIVQVDNVQDPRLDHVGTDRGGIGRLTVQDIEDWGTGIKDEDLPP